MTSRIIPLLALVIALLILFGYVVPTWNGAVANTNAAIATDNQALTAATQYSAEQNQLATERDAIDPTGLSRLEELLPDSVDNVGLILDLDALAARTGLSLSHIDVAQTTSSNGPTSSAVTSQGTVNSVDLSVSAVGSYNSLFNFLQGVESSLRLLDVQEITIKGSDTGVYTYDIRLRLYWLN